MTSTAPAESRLLTSAAFRRARWKSTRELACVDRLVQLLHDVEVKRLMCPELEVGPAALHLDIVCSIVEAHVEELRERRGKLALSTSRQARIRLLVAALHYVVDPDDVVPGSEPHGPKDDATVLTWASRMARGEIGSGE